MTSILILEDQYTKSMYTGLQQYFPDAHFPLTDTIKDPMQYSSMFESADIILLDNYFPWLAGWREEPLWCDVLEFLLEQHSTKTVVCISDYQETLLQKYDVWKTAYMLWIVRWFPSKNVAKIATLIEQSI